MAWDKTMVVILRGIINDLDETTPEFTDTRLQSLLAIAARQVIGDVDFGTTYTVNVDTPDISPDPTLTASLNNPFTNLTVLKAACILAGGEYRLATNKAISIKDGPSSIDGKGIVAAKQAFMSDACGSYEKAELEYRMGNSTAGEAIVGPHRTGAYSSITNVRDRPEFN